MKDVEARLRDSKSKIGLLGIMLHLLCRAVDDVHKDGGRGVNVLNDLAKSYRQQAVDIEPELQEIMFPKEEKTND